MVLKDQDVEEYILVSSFEMKCNFVVMSTTKIGTLTLLRAHLKEVLLCLCTAWFTLFVQQGLY